MTQVAYWDIKVLKEGRLEGTLGAGSLARGGH